MLEAERVQILFKRCVQKIYQLVKHRVSEQVKCISVVRHILSTLNAICALSRIQPTVIVMVSSDIEKRIDSKINIPY